MKLQELIGKLQIIKNKNKLPGKTEVVVDADENGWYSLDDVNVYMEDGYVFLNLKSSNDL